MKFFTRLRIPARVVKAVEVHDKLLNEWVNIFLIGGIISVCQFKHLKMSLPRRIEFVPSTWNYFSFFVEI
jgi:hypothetical protein